MHTIRQTLAEDPELLTVRDKDGWTLLHSAAVCGDRDLVAFLIEKGAEVNARSEDGHTSLYLMAFYGHNGDEGYAEVAKLLLAEGVDPNAGNMDGDTPLAQALSWGRLVDDNGDPVAGASEMLGGFIRVLREHGAKV